MEAALLVAARLRGVTAGFVSNRKEGVISEPERAEVCNGLLADDLCEVYTFLSNKGEAVGTMRAARAAHVRRSEGKPSGFTEGEGSS